MFTGLVQNLGTVADLKKNSEELRLCVSCALPALALQQGASIAVDGVCLTVESFEGDCFWATAVQETLEKTCLSQLELGSLVHLESALTLATPLGGHLMSGHVDGFARVLEPAPRLRLEIGQDLLRFCPKKGSIAVLGVSLTIADAEANWVEMALIPETLRNTKLGALKKGDAVHIEVDMIARYLERLYAASR